MTSKYNIVDNQLNNNQLNNNQSNIDDLTLINTKIGTRKEQISGCAALFTLFIIISLITMTISYFNYFIVDAIVINKDCVNVISGQIMTNRKNCNIDVKYYFDNSFKTCHIIRNSVDSCNNIDDGHLTGCQHENNKYYFINETVSLYVNKQSHKCYSHTYVSSIQNAGIVFLCFAGICVCFIIFHYMVIYQLKSTIKNNNEIELTTISPIINSV